MGLIFAVAMLAVLGVGAWVRLAPSDPVALASAAGVYDR